MQSKHTADEPCEVDVTNIHLCKIARSLERIADTLWLMEAKTQLIPKKPIERKTMV